MSLIRDQPCIGQTAADPLEKEPMIREASTDDVPRMIALSERARLVYEQYAPTFWRGAKDAAEKQAAFFHAQLLREDTLCLVSEHEGQIEGFVIAGVVTAPPVYDPGSPVCMIDDFVVASPDQWATIGRSLLEEARNRAQARGANLSVVVCGHLDEPKREMLRSAGFSIASEWYVNP